MPIQPMKAIGTAAISHPARSRPVPSGRRGCSVASSGC
jgi:hypothetical protein